MASADGSILIRTKVDTNGIKTGTNAIQSGVGKINNSLLKLGGTIAAVFSVYKLIEFGKEAVKLASDLQEVQNVVDVAFGEMAGVINDFADTSIEKMGISELTAKKTASAFGAMANGMGFTSQETAKMSMELTQLSADMASFFNLSQDEARTALTAVFTGETETLKRYGILITEVNLQEYARNQGITQSITKMTQLEKVMLRYNYIMGVTSQVQGDFVRTQGSWANQTRILSELWKEFLTLVGGRLIQVLTPVVTVLNNLLITAINLGNAMANIFGWQVEQSTVAGTTAGYVEDTASSQEDVASATNETNKALKKQLAFFDDINVLSSESASGAGGGASTGGTTGGGGGVVNTDKTVQQLTDLEKQMMAFLERIKQAWKTDADFTFLGEEFAKAVNSMLADIDWDVIKENAYKAGKAIATFLNGAIKDIDWSLIGKSIGESVNTALSSVYGFISNFDFKRAGTSFAELLNGTFSTIDWELTGNTISDGVTGALDFINTAIENFDWDGVGEGIGTGLASIDYLSIIDGVGVAIQNFVLLAIPNFIGGIFDGITQQLFGYDANATIGKALGTIFKDLFSLKNVSAWFSEAGNNFILAFNGEQVGLNIVLGLLNGITAGLGLLLLPFTNLIFNILELFGIHSPSTLFYEIGMYIIEGFLLGLEDFGVSIITWFETMFTTLQDTVIAPWFSIEKWTMVGKTMQDGLKAGFGGIVGWIVGVLNNIIDGFESMINFVVDGANSIVDKFNSLPSAVRLGYTADKFDKVNFGSIPIPKLAQGAVLPPNKPFMSIVGDQKNGTNVEAPLETIKQALAEVMANYNSGGSGSIIFKIGETEVARTLLAPLLNEMSRQGLDTEVLGVV